MRNCLMKLNAVLFAGLSMLQLQAQSDTVVRDIDSNMYNTVRIGKQVWMAENLKTTRLNDGTAILLITDNMAWNNLRSDGKSGYCWYNNDKKKFSEYGVLYNFMTVNTGKLCPTGWHVPSVAEWEELTNYLGGAMMAGDKLKETGNTHWESPSQIKASNETGFFATPGGYRSYGGEFGGIGKIGNWWTATENDDKIGWYMSMYYNNGYVLKLYKNKLHGYSVRCVKD